MTRGLDRNLDLGADAVGRRDKNRIDKTGSFQIEQPTKAADFGSGAGTRGCAHQWFDQVHHAVAGINVDTGGRVASVFHEITNADRRTWLGTAGCRGPPTSESPGVQARRRRYIGTHGSIAGNRRFASPARVRKKGRRGEGVAQALRQVGAT